MQLATLERIAAAVESRRAADRGAGRVFDPVGFGAAFRDSVIDDFRAPIDRMRRLLGV
jgi:hypothetical protein